MGVPKYRIALTDEERESLTRIVRKHTESQHIVRRAKIILRVEEGQQRKAIAADLGIEEHSVIAWVKRWLMRKGDPVVERLQDLQRTGSPGAISPQQWCEIIAMSCENPSEYGLPITDWTHRELAQEVIKQGIVEAISPSHLGRMLKKGTSSRTESDTG
jgi:putative transposase